MKSYSCPIANTWKQPECPSMDDGTSLKKKASYYKQSFIAIAFLSIMSHSCIRVSQTVPAFSAQFYISISWLQLIAPVKE